LNGDVEIKPVRQGDEFFGASIAASKVCGSKRHDPPGARPLSLLGRP
jgi:hypothetical protein